MKLVTLGVGAKISVVGRSENGKTYKGWVGKEVANIAMRVRRKGRGISAGQNSGEIRV